MASVPKRKEIYKYEAPWTIYGTSWSVRHDKKFRLAIGSFIEEYNNKVQVNLSVLLTTVNDTICDTRYRMCA